jgi:acetyl-CoA carboxylase biotin carboxyl carrier protein
VDLSELKQILRILDEQEITEFELEQDGVKLRICRAAGSTAPATVSLHPSSADGEALAPTPRAAPSAASEKPAAESAGDGDGAGAHLPSPIVGTFYRSPDPNSPPFVNIGDRVQVGQVLCIIEAMKLMNEIEAEMAGEIVKIHPENGQAVQYGDSLFTIRPA